MFPETGMQIRVKNCEKFGWLHARGRGPSHCKTGPHMRQAGGRCRAVLARREGRLRPSLGEVGAATEGRTGGALPLAAIGAARPENESDGKRAKPKALGSGPLVFRKPGLAGQHDENHVVVIPPNDAFHLQLPAQAQRALHLFA